MKFEPRQPEALLAIDPGKTTGVALYLHRRLVTAFKATPDQMYRQRLSELFNTYKLASRQLVVVVEVPRVYPQERSENDPNIEVDLALLAGNYQGMCRALDAENVETVYPNQWKGTIPKPKKLPGQERPGYIIEERLLANLTWVERERLRATKSARAKYLDHNIVDAGYIGIWRLERRTNEIGSIHR